MLEVMEKADRLHVDQPMRRSMDEASTSDDPNIRFNEVTLSVDLLTAEDIVLVFDSAHFRTLHSCLQLQLASPERQGRMWQ